MWYVSKERPSTILPRGSLPAPPHPGATKLSLRLSNTFDIVTGFQGMRLFYIRRRFGKIGVVGRQQPHPRAAAVRLDGKVRLSVVCRLVPGGSGDMSALVLLGSFFSNGLFPEEGILYLYLDPIFLETPWKENISPSRWGAVAECTTMLAPQIWGLLATAAPDCTLAALGHPIHGHPPKNFQ